MGAKERKPHNVNGTITRGAHSVSRNDIGRRLRVFCETQRPCRHPARADRIRGRRHGRRLDLELARARHGTIGIAGSVRVRARGGGLLDRDFVFMDPGSCRSPFASRQRRAGRGQGGAQSKHDARFGRHAAQHPGRHGGWRGAGRRGAKRNDFPRFRDGALAWHRDSKLSRRGDHFATVKIGRHGEGESVWLWRLVGRRGADRRGGDDFGRALCRARPAGAAQLRGRRDDVCCRRGTHPGNVGRQAFQRGNALVRGRIHAQDRAR